MKAFTEAFLKIDSTTSTNSKVEILRDYFTSAPPKDAVWALFLLMGRNTKRIMTGLKLREVMREHMKIPEWLLDECQAHVGDSAETIALLLPNLDLNHLPAKNLPLHEWLEAEIPKLSTLTENERGMRIIEWWQRLKPSEVFVFNKLLTGAFRVGVSSKIVIKALSAAFGITEQVLSHRLMGFHKPSEKFFNELTATATETLASHPYPFYLAHPLTEDRITDEELKDWFVEWKWDGIRAQLIKREGEFYIWSRGEDLLTEKFPELETDARLLPNGTVIDGEILAWLDGVLPFHYLQTRIGRKKLSAEVLRNAPVKLLAFDLLEWEGLDIRESSLSERRKLLEKLFLSRQFTNLLIAPALVAKTFADLEKLRGAARLNTAEGLMLKRKNSPYGVGRKVGDWWKFKTAPMTLDAVLVYAQAGSGKRANLFTDYTFALWTEDIGGKRELVAFAKAYSGLDNKEIDELDRWIRRNTKEKFGPVRVVEPIHVFELAFEGIAPSKRHKSGVAVRFPRILRWRKDKLAAEADSLKSAFELIKLRERVISKPLDSQTSQSSQLSFGGLV